MKRFISMMALLFTLTFTANAMSYEQARQQALFLTDKMAYELNLTDDQYEAAYEINLDYLMSVNTVDDLYGSYWRYRNLDMSYVLLDWQYRAFCDAAYFYRPLYFSGGYWRFGIYARYPHRDYFFFNRPNVYVSYCGGHSWRMNHGRSWYDGRHFGPRPGGNHFGMRDSFNRGDYGRGNRQSFGTRQPQRPQTSFGTQQPQRPQTSFGRQPQTTAGQGSFGNRPTGSGSQVSFGNRGNAGGTQSTRPGSSFGNRESSTRATVNLPSATTPQGTFGRGRSGQTTSTPRSTFTPAPRNNTTFSNPVPVRQPSSSSSSPSFGGSSRGGSFGGGSARGGSFGGGSSRGGNSGGGSFGSRR